MARTSGIATHLGHSVARICAGALVVAGLSVAALAAETRSITWEDLVPAAPPLENPVFGLDTEVRRALGTIDRVRSDVQYGFITADSEEARDAERLVLELKARGVDFDEIAARVAAVEAEIERRGQDVVTELDGAVVRMPGYALPLEFSETGVMEILLVPFVGACIHAPPPPPNQTVYVELDRAYMPEGLYDPVWITGRLSTRASTRRLSFVDGQADIPTGYSIKALSIEPYQ